MYSFNIFFCKNTFYFSFISKVSEKISTKRDAYALKKYNYFPFTLYVSEKFL